MKATADKLIDPVSEADPLEGDSPASAPATVIEFPRRGLERENAVLIEEYQRCGKQAVLEEILSRNQGLLHAVLRRFSYFPDPYEDLLQVANLGLIKAVQRFDPSRKVEFSSYATSIVDGEVRHYLRDNTLMRQPRWLRRAERDIESASIELTRRLKRRPTVTELSEGVNISVEGIMEILKASARAALHSVDDPLNENRLNYSLDAEVVRSRYYQSFSLPIEDRIVLEDAIESLSLFHKKLVYLLFYQDLTQTEVAAKLGLNQRKVSRESAKALSRLKAILTTKIF